MDVKAIHDYVNKLTDLLHCIFSAIRWVNMWNRSMKGDARLQNTTSVARLSRLCMLSVNRKRVEEVTEVIDKVMNKFGQQARRLQLLFKSQLNTFLILLPYKTDLFSKENYIAYFLFMITG